MAVTGRLPAILGIQLSGLGRQAPRLIARSRYAYAAAVVDVGGRDSATSQAAFAELVPSPWGVFTGCLKGLNGKVKLTMEKANGFKFFNVADVALLHTL
jgi:hypothetical protein